MERVYLGIDIGGTAAKMGIMTGDGMFLARRSVPVAFDQYETPIIDTVKKEAQSFLNEFEDLDSDKEKKVVAAGVSATGQIDMNTGVVTGAAAHIRNWEGTPIKDALEKALKMPVYVGNDANCAALGEYWLGAASGEKNSIVMTVGTGVGGGILVDGHLLTGAHGIAGELGHMIIKGDGERCSCGNDGCLERYGSTVALIRMVKSGVKNGNIPMFSDEINGISIFKELEARQNKGPLANTVRMWIGYLADGLVGLVHIFNPSMILVGGGVSEQEDLFIRPLEKMVKERVMPSFKEGLRLEKAALGNMAGMVGAVYLCKEQGV